MIFVKMGFGSGKPDQTAQYPTHEKSKRVTVTLATIFPCFSPVLPPPRSSGGSFQLHCRQLSSISVRRRPLFIAVYCSLPHTH